MVTISVPNFTIPTGGKPWAPSVSNSQVNFREPLLQLKLYLLPQSGVSNLWSKVRQNSVPLTRQKDEEK